MAKPSAISRFLSKKSILDVDFAIILMSNSCHTCMGSRMVRISAVMIRHQRVTFHVLVKGVQRIAMETHNSYKREGDIVLAKMDRQK